MLSHEDTVYTFPICDRTTLSELRAALRRLAPFGQAILLYAYKLYAWRREHEVAPLEPHVPLAEAVGESGTHRTEFTPDNPPDDSDSDSLE
jgi:hypothetical protein